MFSFLKKDPDKKAKAKIDGLYKKAIEAQRNGKIRLYGELMTEIHDLEKNLKEKKTVSN